MTPWWVVVRGIRYRAGRSLVLLALIGTAVAATVLAPAYTRAAQESLLADRLAAAHPNALALHVGEDGGTLTEAKARVVAPPHYDTVPVGGASVDTSISGDLDARIAYRDSVCDHLTITSGSCPTGNGVVVSERSAREHDIGVGDSLEHLRVVGLYVPTEPASPYWGRGGYFAEGSTDSARPRIDAVFVGSEQALPPGVRRVELDYAFEAGSVGLDDIHAVRDGVTRFQTTLNAADFDVDTAAVAIVDAIDAELSALARMVPVVAVPLVLISWFVVFLAVAAVAEERSVEAGLAKLRGYERRQVTALGADEPTIIALAAVVLGIVAGVGAVEVIGRWRLGVGVNIAWWPVYVAAGLSLPLALAIVRLASRRPLRRPALLLLRRVPGRSSRAGVIAEGAAFVLAAAVLVAALADRGSPLALLAPALLAVVAGIVAGRGLKLWSRMRLRRHASRGAITGVLAHAQLARRPGARRVVVTVTVAVALLSFAGAAWDVAAQARADAAMDAVGAHRVLRVSAANPSALVSAVSAAAGDRAMPVVRVTERYDTATVELLAVDTGRLAGASVWRGRTSSEVDALGRTLRGLASGDIPVAVAGTTPADDADAEVFPFPGLGDGAQRYRVVSHVDFLPRASGRALLVDLETAVAAAERGSGVSDNSRLRYEVWAGTDAPADLASRLAGAGVSILDEESVASAQARLAMGAPALALGLGLLAGAVAVCLAVGTVLLTAYLGSRARRHELAALRVTGVRRPVLRRALAREYAHLLVLPGLVGVLVGVAGAALALPGIPLVTANSAAGHVALPAWPQVSIVAAAATMAGLVLAMFAVLRLVSSRSSSLSSSMREAGS
jgi:hypothetical protein